MNIPERQIVFTANSLIFKDAISERKRWAWAGPLAQNESDWLPAGIREGNVSVMKQQMSHTLVNTIMDPVFFWASALRTGKNPQGRTQLRPFTPLSSSDCLHHDGFHVFLENWLFKKLVSGSSWCHFQTSFGVDAANWIWINLVDAPLKPACLLWLTILH